MANAVILSAKDNGNINRVYTPAVLTRLHAEHTLYETPIGPHNAREHAQALAQAEVAFSTWGMPAFTVEQIKEWMPNLQAVFYAAGSVQGFAAPFLEAGKRVFSAWGANAVPVAQVTASQIILANKGFFQSSLLAKQDYGYSRIVGNAFPGNYAVRVGLLGAGMIGRMVIRLLKLMQDAPDELDILVYDPFLPEEAAKELGVHLASLEEVFSTCQTVSNHLANKKEIENLINYSLLSLMPVNGTFVNTGRGAQVNEADLYRALSEEPGRAAVLDVTFPEPPDTANNPLFSLPNVFLTPHTAGSISNECARQAMYMLDECAAMLSGRPVRFEVSPAMLSTMA